jgi:hypothetical protein
MDSCFFAFNQQFGTDSNRKAMAQYEIRVDKFPKPSISKVMGINTAWSL